MDPRPPTRVRHPGHLALDVPDLPRTLDFYTRVIGLTVVEQVEDVAYLRTQFEHHCLVLHQASAPGVRHFGWETESDEETDAFRSFLKQRDVSIREAPPEPGRRGTAFQFQDPLGFWHEVYRAQDRLPVLVPQGPAPVLRLGHFTHATPDPDAALAFFRSVGFRVSDWVPGNQAFLRCSPDHHNLAYLKFERTLLHHHAYQVPDWGAIKGMLDRMALHRWPVEAGPVRHAAGNNIAVYVRDPNALRVEFYCEMERIEDDEDHDTRRQPVMFDLWHQKPPPPGFRD